MPRRHRRRHHRAHAHHRHGHHGHHGHYLHHRSHRIGGFGRRHRFRNRVRHRRRRTHGGGGGGGGFNLFLCCFGLGSNSTPNQTIQKDVQEIQMTQQQFLAYYTQMQQQQQQQPGQIDPGFQAASQEQAKEIQQEQKEILEDILTRQAAESDPEKLQHLIEQQNLLQQQMVAFQASGFQYEGGIPSGQGPPPSAPQFQPMDTSYNDPPPSYETVMNT